MARRTDFDREQVVANAMNVFWEQGYELTSIEDLTTAMAIKTGSLYNTFRDKHALYLESLDLYLRTAGCCIFIALSDPDAGRAAVEQVFADLIAEIMADTDQRGCFMLNAKLERATHDPDVKLRAIQANAVGEDLFYRALTNAQQMGEIGVDRDLRALAAYCMVLIQGVRATAKANPSRTALEAIVQVGLTALA
ncbi:MAG: TetR/AcrR family transcriptional regulator [Chloroflexota bacterium]|nr:TetR/AcrR family transcriptional regulator [Chloroflexota bacterium]